MVESAKEKKKKKEKGNDRYKHLRLSHGCGELKNASYKSSLKQEC